MSYHRIARSSVAVAAALTLAFGLASCSDGKKSGSDFYVIGGATMTYDLGYDLTGSIVLLEDTMTPVFDGATVTVNGDELMPFFGAYYGSVTPVLPGESIPFSISYEGMSVNTSLTAPSSVSITAPAGGSSSPANSGLVVSWTASSETPAPDWVQVSVSSTYTNSGDGISELVPFSSGTFTIPADSLKVGTSVPIVVSGATMKGLSGSGVKSGSILIVENERRVTVNVTSS
jgi:hypothetical protein